ncbi:MAG: hypothetical protein Q8L45_00250 [Xanthomonadaceae bacterium]|nr:hypothetical protein [Xanthomonadaceae bacterium]MDP2184350.1 hypothetical protein [Xanthomonadales bacterium]MDZ4114682.1 hypothetical protein [Xanthomonadaceae bacterium]MDZ4377952.1 hypothetical protein [Xanthomonadaceae bacterium]
MKRLLVVFAATLAIGASVQVHAADVGVSISIGQPGYYGRIDIGDYPRPQLLYSQPRMVQRRAARAPIYLRVKPGHARHWSRYCGEYNACDQRVYFVRDTWYNHVYVPQYRERRHDRHDDHGNNDRGGRRDDRRDDHDNDHDDKRGKGHDNGHH